MSITTVATNSQALAGKALTVLGAGKMGGILLRALLEGRLLDPAKTRATVGFAEEVASASRAFPAISITTHNAEAVRGADIVLVSVKPHQITAVLEEVRPVLHPGQLFISIAAGVPTSLIEKALGSDTPVVRAMPNTPAAVRQGITALTKGKFARDEHIAIAEALFQSVGRTAVVDEKNMDAITGLSGSGPAYIYIVIEALAEAGVKVGLPRDLATLLAAQTTLGSAQMVLETGSHPALLKDAVTTPAGCTVDGVMELEEGKLRVTLIKAVVKATQRAHELVFTR
jgi:pyrroline-5-carboxylate reductase